MTETNEKPLYEYASWAYRDRKAMKTAGNNRYPTRAIFAETTEEPSLVLYTLDPAEKFYEGRWLPSAWLIYVYAVDEYDAARKLVGNMRHWEVLKNTDWFKPILAEWQAEHSYQQRSRMRAAVYATAVSGGPGSVAAARTIMQMLEGSLGAKGRPAKPKDSPRDDGDVAKDLERMRSVSGS